MTYTPSHSNRSGSRGPVNTLAVGVGLLMVPIVLMVLTSATYAFGGTVQPYMFPVAVGVALLVTLGMGRGYLSWGWTVLALVVSLGLAWLNIDYSFDGPVYHQEIMYVLAHDGWCPNNLTNIPDMQMWSLHYCKLLETCGACIYATTGSLNAAKSINIILLISMACLAYAALRPYLPSRTRTRWAVVVLCCNPVLLSQLPTTYNDYAAYVYVVMTLSLILLLYQCPAVGSRLRPVVFGLLIAAVTLMAAGTKYTAFYYQGLVLIGWTLWLLWHREWAYAVAVALCSIVVAAVGVLAVFYHPYVTNTLIAGHPLYPLVGAGAVDIMSHNSPFGGEDISRVESLWWCLVTYRLAPGYDTRLGGWGPLMIVMIPLALIAMFMQRRHRVPSMAWWVVVIAGASSFTFEQTWWPRYIPQLWLLVAVPVIALGRSRGIGAWCRHLLTWLAVATAILTLSRYAQPVCNDIETRAVCTATSGSEVALDRASYLRIDSLILAQHGATVVLVDADSMDMARCIKLSEGGSPIQLTPERYDSLQRIHAASPLMSHPQYRKLLNK